MAKPDFPALLQPGMHSMALNDVYALAVVPFPEDAQRRDLHQKLTTWAKALHACGVAGTLWMDGSFLTGKPSPSDIDCVLWHPHWINSDRSSPANQRQVQRLLDHSVARNVFSLDLYVEVPAPDKVFHREAYWRGVLGFCHNRSTAKGFAEVIL